MSVDQKVKRRTYFIKKKFQTQFILKFCILVLVSAGISGGVLSFFLRHTATTAFVNSRLTIVRTSDYILPSLISSSVISIILVGVATIAVVMFLSHRIAGPLFHVERCVASVGEGNLTCRVNLRSTDEVAALAESFNKMIEAIETKVRSMQACSQRLREDVERLANAHGQDTARLTETLKKRQQELDALISQFTIHNA